MIRKLQLLVATVVLVVAAFSTALPFLFYLAVPGDPGHRRLVRPGPPGPDRPRGGLRRQPAPRSCRRPGPGDLHAAQRQPDRQAVARDPQPDDAARRPARSGDHARRAAASGRGSSASRCRGAATSGSSRSTSGPAIRSASSRRRRPSARASRWSSTRASSRCRAGGCRRPRSRAAGVAPVRTLQTTPLATTVRPYAPGDSMNRIHWKSTARHDEIQVKEFDLEQTADAWIVLDLQRSVQTGRGDDSTVESAVRAAASIADKALQENRAVGMTVNVGADGVPPARPRRPPAPQDHAAPRLGRGRQHDAAGRDADRDRRPAAARDDRGRHHAVARPVLGPAAGVAPGARRRLRGRCRSTRPRSTASSAAARRSWAAARHRPVR